MCAMHKGNGSSRYPQMFIELGIRKCYYFPAESWELANSKTESPRKFGARKLSKDQEDEVFTKNMRSVQRLILNNTTALTLFIPQWDHEEYEDVEDLPEDSTLVNNYWQLDKSLGSYDYTCLYFIGESALRIDGKI